MPTFFPAKPGQAVALDLAGGDVALPLVVAGISGSWFPRFKSIVTELSVALDGNYQFLHTLKDVIYVYVFGDRISQISVSGLSFADSCPGDGTSGIEKILGFYEENRIAAREEPVQIAIGTGSSGRFRGSLTHFRANLVKPEARISQFSFIFHVFPEAAQ